MTRSKLTLFGSEPAVCQMEEAGKARLSWNPDDNHFYVEVPTEGFPDEWITISMFDHGKTSGWRNALWRYKQLCKETQS